MSQQQLGTQHINRNLSTFALTADQRYLLGNDIFLRTHFPMKLRQYQDHNSATIIDENDLLGRLLNGRNILNGNRLWVVYGIPGSGKSELMRWLETQLQQKNVIQAKSMVRISRNELDVLSITERFKEMLPNSFFSETTYARWNKARKKPRAIAKLVLLFALENLLDSDEVINALFYRLLNVIQPHIEKILAIPNEESLPQCIELISLEIWEIVISETSLPIPLEYEQFRHQLITAFSQHILEGLSLPDTLRQISQEVRRSYGTRPLLLVDDLVQSLNLFASDILDYFITLEEGNWDVVIGLTPAAFEASQRGRSLLERIAYLDTIDDRVEKLWLSDEAGYESYVITEENCHEFAEPYLKEYHNKENATALYPLNREALVRIYRGLPTGKGKPRYFLRHLRTILEATTRDEPLLPVVARYARIEYTARCADKQLATLCECYGPLVSDETIRDVTLPAELLSFFHMEGNSITLPIEPLFKIHLHHETTTEITSDDEKVAVYDWLSGQNVNRQLLKSLRQGATRLLRTVSFLTAICSPDTARPHGILNWQKPYLDVHLPIHLEGIDECDGILLQRKVGPIAFDLYRYAHAVGAEAKGLEVALLNSPHILHFLFNASDYREKVVALLEGQLGMNLELFALGLQLWRIDIRDEYLNEEIPTIEHVARAIRAEPRYLWKNGGKQWERYQKEWIQVFEDFFKLRENLYDVPRLATMCSNKSLQDIKENILFINPAEIGKEYRWGKRFLHEVVAEWQEMMRRELSRNDLPRISSNTQEWVDHLQDVGHMGIPLMELPSEVINVLTREDIAVASRLRVYLAP